jgi:exosortase/archaeosortase family protein
VSGIKAINTRLSKYFDVMYFFKFLLLLTTLYYFNIFYIAITDPQGRIYSSFLENNLNYLSWLRNSILYFSNQITHSLGLNTYVLPPFRLKVLHGPSVETVYACLGLGLMSFWIAFVATEGERLKKKLLWSICGVAVIWFINCWRIALLLAAMQRGLNINKYVDHHTLFNIIAYLLIGLLIWLFKSSQLEKTIEKV